MEATCIEPCLQSQSASPCSFQSLLPNVVTTNMSKVKRQALFTPSPATYVKSAVGTIGILSRTSGYWPHSLMVRYVVSREQKVCV